MNGLVSRGFCVKTAKKSMENTGTAAVFKDVEYSSVNLTGLVSKYIRFSLKNMLYGIN